MINVILIALIVLFAAGGIRSAVKRAHGESCCIGGASEVQVEVHYKKNKNYPFTATVKIEGMKCQNCARHIQNKLNENGMWAKVKFPSKTAVILLKEENSKEKIQKIIEDSGYSLTSYIQK